MNMFGLAVTIVTSSDNKLETKAFLELLGFPFKKDLPTQAGEDLKK